MSVKKKRTIGPCRGVTWLYYVVLLWSRDFFLSLYLDPRFRPLLLKYTYPKTCKKVQVLNNFERLVITTDNFI